jgi:hypothetical protein
MSEGKPQLKDVQFSWNDLTQFYKMPCFTKAILYGIPIGTVIGTLTYYQTKRLKTAGNFFFISLFISSSICWEYCRYQKKIIRQQFDEMARQMASNNSQ